LAAIGACLDVSASSAVPTTVHGAAILKRRISELVQVAAVAAHTAKKMADEAASVQDEIDGLLGNDTSIEDRRHEKKLADLKAEAEASGKQNSAEYRHLIDLENQLHELKLKNIRKEKGDNSPPPGAGGLGRPGGSGAGSGQPAPAPAPENQPTPPPPGRASSAPTIQTTMRVVLLSGDEKAANDLADLLSRRIDKNLKTIANRSR